jgi:5-hydroxyisourate hydrolase-like protein (transthyretin family)
MRRAVQILSAFVLLTTALAVGADAARTDDQAGTIVGVVLDANGKPIADAIVVAQAAAQKMRQAIETQTDSDGKFKLEKVLEGDYNLKFRTRDLKLKATRSASVIAGRTTDVGKVKLKAS